MKKLLFPILLIFSIINAQDDFRTSTYDWITGLDETVGARYQKLSIGFRSGIGKIDFRDTKVLDQKVTIPEIEIEYGDYYSFLKNNPHNFTSYNSLKISLGYLTSCNIKNKLNPEGFRFGISFSSGFGYNFSDLQVIPYNKSEIIRQFIKYDNLPSNKLLQPEPKFYPGNNREAGLIIGLNPNLDLNIAYCNISFSNTYKFVNRVTATLAENGLKRIISYGLQELISKSVLFPAINFVAEFAISYLFISLNKYKHFFPFENKENFSTGSFQIGIRKKFDISLF